MPEILKKDNGDTDWNRFFMAMAMAVVFVMQTYSQMQHEESRSAIREIEKTTVPRAELDDHMRFNEENKKKVFRDIDRRLDDIELEHQKLFDTLSEGGKK